jgi:pyruvate dehydrogenase E1 component beta subunit
MFGGQVKLPVTIRMPGGGGHQLASQHSNSLEAYFVHAPGLIVVYPSTPASAKGLLKAAIRDDNPVIFLEHEGLYNIKGEVPQEMEPWTIGEARVAREGEDVTIVACGGMAYVAKEAAEQLADDGVEAEVIDLLSLRPWDAETVVESVAKTHRAVVVSETPPACGIASEIAANIYELAFDELDAPLARVSRADCPLPYAHDLEQSCIPHAPEVIEAVNGLLGR